MDPRTRQLLVGVFPMVVSPPPDITGFLKMIFFAVISIVKTPPEPLLGLRYRIIDEAVDTWEGNDVFQIFSRHRYSFYQTTGETLETLLDILRQIGNNVFQNDTGRPYKLSPRNRVMFFMLWLRSYPCYHMLTLIFDVSVTTIHEEINRCIPVFYQHFHHLVHWPSLDEWTAKMGNWEKLPMAVGAIDGTSTEIYRPLVEPQELYFSGHRHFHCVHTQVVIDNLGKICYIDAGFLGHQNDAQQFAMMRSIGRNAELDFPDGIVLLADKIYPNRYPLMTPYTRQQIQRKPDNLKRRCRKINNLIKEYTVEYSIGELKNYRVIGSLWRHPRRKLRQIVNICAAFVCRRNDLFR